MPENKTLRVLTLILVGVMSVATVWMLVTLMNSPHAGGSFDTGTSQFDKK